MISTNAIRKSARYNVVDPSLHSSFSLTGKVARTNITYLEIQWTNGIMFDFAKVLLKNPGKLSFSYSIFIYKLELILNQFNIQF